MCIHIDLIPDEIINEYNLRDFVDENGFVYMEINKGMYGLLQAGILANRQLTKFLAPDGDHPCTFTPGLWKHKDRPILFTLVVDDFGIKYVGHPHAEHLLKVLQEHYTVTTDWEGSRYCGISLKWDYTNGTVELSMPGYVEEALHHFQYAKTKETRRFPIRLGTTELWEKSPNDTTQHFA